MVKPMRLPSLMYSCTARSRSSYEYMNCLQVVQEFVRIPSGSVFSRRQQSRVRQSGYDSLDKCGFHCTPAISGVTEPSDWLWNRGHSKRGDQLCPNTNAAPTANVSSTPAVVIYAKRH